MKKYLIAGALALVCNGLLTSCGEDFENYGSLEEAKKAQFAENFEKFYGTPDPNQDWGFGDASVVTARARTRGANDYGTVIKKDEPGYPTSIAPAPITKAEAEWVTKWFQNNPGLTKQGQPFQNFFVQFVSGDQSNKKGVWHRYDQNRINNGYDSNSWDEEFTDNGGMDKLHVGAVRDQSKTAHLNDFNAKTGGPWDVVYVKNGSALQFGYHSSWGEDNKSPNGDGYYWYFKMVKLKVPGSCFDDGQERMGWYVGLSLYGKKYDNGDKEIGVQRLQYAEDWIVKVVPGEVLKRKEVKEHKWVFCEDLGRSSVHEDLDYNDLVFDAKIIEEYKVLKEDNGNETEYGNEGHTIMAEITPLAAGGELLITFGSSGRSAHDLFTSHPAKNVLINTCKEGVDYALSHVEGLPGETFKYDFGSSQPSIKDIPIIVRTTSGTATALYELTAEIGDAPNKICVPPGTRWLYERVPIDSAYTSFRTYVTKRTPEPWNTNIVESYLYPIDNLSDYLTTSQKDSVYYVPVDDSSDPVVSKYDMVNPNYEKELWSDATGSTTFYTKDDNTWGGDIFIDANRLSAEKIGEGTIILFYFASNNDYMIKVTDSTWKDFDLGDAEWDINFLQGYSAYNGCVAVTLNAETAERFKNNGIRFYGTGVTALAVTYDNSNIIGDNGDNNGDNHEENNGDAFWSSTSYGTQQLISTANLKNAGIDSNKSMTVKITGTPLSWGWGEIKILKSWTPIITTKSDSTPQYAHFDENPGYVAIPVTANQIMEILATEGLRIEINNFNYSKVELLQ